MTKSTFLKSIAAGFCGSVAHSLLMFFKSRLDIIPAFRPYDDLQARLADMFGPSIHPAISWALSFLNGALILGFVFARGYLLLPGRTGLIKGLIFGLLGWVAMGLFFFPILGRGLFAVNLGLGPMPALFSLAMVLTYSVVLGIAYSALRPSESPSTKR